MVLKPSNEMKFFVKLKCQSSTKTLSVRNKYSVRDLGLFCDVVNNA